MTAGNSRARTQPLGTRHTLSDADKQQFCAPKKPTATATSPARTANEGDEQCSGKRQASTFSTWSCTKRNSKRRHSHARSTFAPKLAVIRSIDRRLLGGFQGTACDGCKVSTTAIDRPGRLLPVSLHPAYRLRLLCARPQVVSPLVTLGRRLRRCLAVGVLTCGPTWTLRRLDLEPDHTNRPLRPPPAWISLATRQSDGHLLGLGFHLTTSHLILLAAGRRLYCSLRGSWLCQLKHLCRASSHLTSPCESDSTRQQQVT
jgi:hypothetical protein